MNNDDFNNLPEITVKLKVKDMFEENGKKTYVISKADDNHILSSEQQHRLGIYISAAAQICVQDFIVIKDNVKKKENDFQKRKSVCNGNMIDFKINDKLMNKNGSIATVISICDCEQCRKRGFLELVIQFDDGTEDYIMVSEYQDGFPNWVKIE